MNIDFLAGESHFADHARPIWDNIENKGTFYTDRTKLKKSKNPTVVLSWGDLREAYKKRKKIIFGEHGCGFSYDNKHSSYVGSSLLRDRVILRMVPNQFAYDIERAANPLENIKIVGVPKMDKWAGREFVRNKKPVIALSFHWDCRVCPETMSGYKEFLMAAIKKIPTEFKLIGHGHPRIMDLLEERYKACGIEVVRDFNEVMERADVYMCDNSSTIYEFAFLDKPVVVINPSFYRKDKEYPYNPRFWKYANVGVNLDHPDNILRSIREALRDTDRQKELRREAVKAVFTYTDGKCSERAAQAIMEATKNES